MVVNKASPYGLFLSAGDSHGVWAARILGYCKAASTPDRALMFDCTNMNLTSLLARLVVY